MRNYVFLLLLSLLGFSAHAQSPVVPNNIYFADMHLEIKDDARAEIQKMVDALTRHPAYFQKKVDLADAYFPFVEQAFAQEGVPTDFKYLALQESGLVSDAVSTSNAVGFWQFKEGSATDVGVRVNSLVDERKHIIESSRGAAKYLLRNNLYYQNWFNSLLSYYQGLTGTKALTKTSDIGAKKMQVDLKTNRYLLTFLAHKVAYENAIGKNPNPQLALVPVKALAGQSLLDIASEAQADVAEVERYNKWLTAAAIPNDKVYTVLIPVTGAAARPVALAQAGPVKNTGITASTTADAVEVAEETKGEPKTIFSSRRKSKVSKLNGLKAVVAQQGDTKDKLALKADISTRRFLKYNDLRTFDPIVPGETYYLEGKNSKAATSYHIARTGETMRELAQKYGVKLNKLLSKNRMSKTEALAPGRLVWLRDTRPRTTPIEFSLPKDEVAPAPQQVIAQKTAAPEKPVAQKGTSTKKEEPAKKEVAAKEVMAKVEEPVKPVPAKVTAEPVLVQVTPVPAAAQAAPAPAYPVKPKPGAISVEVEDTTAAPYVPLAQKDLEDEEQDEDIDSLATFPAKTIPTKTVASQTKPEPIAQPKSPDEPLHVEVIPAASTQKAKPTLAEGATTHVVEKGETLYAISKLHNVSMEDLLAWNQLDVNAPLALGQELSLTGAKSGTSVVAAPASSGNIATTPASVSEHTVSAGETLYSISRKYNISLADLQKWNDLSATGAISIGQKLMVSAPTTTAQTQTEPTAMAAVSPPAPAKTPAGVVTHKVASGESMYAISRKYGVTIKEIMEWNNKPDFAVSVGESLVIKVKP